MKITNKLGTGPQNVDASKATKTKNEGRADQKSSDIMSKLGDTAKVNVSNNAQAMAKAKQIASGGESVDEAKVARLQKLIDDGKYSVDAKAVADRLVDEHLNMGE